MRDRPGLGFRGSNTLMWPLDGSQEQQLPRPPCRLSRGGWSLSRPGRSQVHRSCCDRRLRYFTHTFTPTLSETDPPPVSVCAGV